MKIRKNIAIATSVGIVAVIAISVLGHKLNKANEEIVVHKNTIKELNESLTNTKDELARTEDKRAQLEGELYGTKKTVEQIKAEAEDKDKVISGLQKLTTLDPELLKKYSKVYFLNENYSPAKLAPIDPKYLANKDRGFEFHGDAIKYLYKMLDRAALDGVSLNVVSAYRSFGTQAALKSSYKVTYGAGTANQFSADQGYSEHQLAVAADFGTANAAAFNNFEKTDAYAWLQNNAYKFGFILSYPAGNNYYQFEPWHWRYVGVSLAGKLHTENKNFYDLDQRDIDAYIKNFFD